MLAGSIAALVVVVGNIMSNPAMPSPDVASDTARLFELRGAIVCANEIEPQSYKSTFRRYARSDGYRTAALSASPNPVAVRHASPWRAATVRVRVLSRGVQHVSPERRATVVQLVDDSGHRAVVVCAHFVSRAWTHVESSTKLRRELWHDGARVVRGIVRRWHALGAVVVVAGDLNHPTTVRWARRQRTLANVGLLQVAVIVPRGYRVERTRGRMISTRQLFTDHPMLRRGIGFVS
jgi:endonuclease/exonuclease/phosphatase family metal-dependent hydrolase